MKANLLAAGVTLYGGPKAAVLLNISETSTMHHEYSSLACTVEIVDDVYAAVDHIHQYGRSIHFSYFVFFSLLISVQILYSSYFSILTFSPPLSSHSLFCSAHTDCIVTEDHEVAEFFLSQVDR